VAVVKNYINAQDRTRHIIILAMQETINDLANCDALSEEEKKALKTAYKNIIKFNKLMFERFGEAYQRKIETTMQSNTLRLVGKYEKVNECVSHSAVEDLEKAIKELQMFNCLDCTKCDYVNCGTYACLIACDVDGEEFENGCPFRL
jgi:hypothetical protein